MTQPDQPNTSRDAGSGGLNWGRGLAVAVYVATILTVLAFFWQSLSPLVFTGP